MPLTDRISLLLLLRRLDKALEEQTAQMRRQNDLLARLVEKFAPEEKSPEVANPREKSMNAGSDSEFARLEEHLEKIRRETGKEPSEEELVAWLEEGAENPYSKA